MASFNGNGNGNGQESLIERYMDPDEPSTDVNLDIDKEQNKDSKERGLRIGLWVVAAVDAIAMITIIVAILVQQSNRDNYIFLLNVPHVLWWFVVALITNVSANKAWWGVFIGFSALWLVMDVGSLVWRAILLHNCYDSSSGNSCRDFLTQEWFIIIANGVFIVTDIVSIALSIVLRRKVMYDRLRCKAREEECERLRQAQRMHQQRPCPPMAPSCPVRPQYAQQSAFTAFEQRQQQPSTQMGNFSSVYGTTGATSSATTTTSNVEFEF